MKKLAKMIISINIIIFMIAGCNMPIQSQEPMTWIDQPLENAQLPLAPVTILAHAVDADGIASIEFLIFEDLIASVSTGGTRMENASIEWKPQKSGSYTFHVRAVDTQGNTNARSMAKVNISIGSENTPTDTPSPMESYTPTAANTETPGPNSTEKPTLILTDASNPTFTLLQNANCRRGPATVFDLVDAITQGTSVAIEGRNADNSWFWVQKPSGNGNCWVSSVTGTARGNFQILKVIATPSLPTTATPTIQVLEILPIDTTPPSISNVAINPVSVQQKGCGSPDTITISSNVTDSSGVANVIYEITGPGPMDAGDGYLLPVGGDKYQAVIGPIAGSTGTWSILLHATDMNQISSQAGPWNVQVLCIQ